MHVHSAPDLIPRLMDDVHMARQAKTAGMEAIVLKSHLFSTVGRAWLVNKLVSGIQVRGGVVVNQAATGGLNSAAVRANLALGAKVIWMPTMAAGNGDSLALFGTAHWYQAMVGPTTVDLEDPATAKRARAILRDIADACALLATGHLLPKTTSALIELALREGVTKILVTHPDSPVVRMSIHEQVALSRQGVYFERCAYSIVDSRHRVPVEELSAAIRATGIDRNVISSDLGQVGNPPPAAGLRILCDTLARQGFQREEIEVMVKINPGILLGDGDTASTERLAGRF
jgi:hypothetical protein